jgi:predicted transcriptional regulator
MSQSSDRAMPSNLPRITVYLDEETKVKLERLAKLEDRPASNFLLVLAKKAIEEAERDGRLK